MSDGACAAYTVDGIFPCGFHIVANRGEGTKSGYNYSFKFHIIQLCDVNGALQAHQGQMQEFVSDGGIRQ